MALKESFLRLDKVSLSKRTTKGLQPSTVSLVEELVRDATDAKLTPDDLIRMLGEAAYRLRSRARNHDPDYEWSSRSSTLEAIRLLDDFCPDVTFMARLHSRCRQKLYLDPPFRDPFALADMLQLDFRELQDDFSGLPPATAQLRDWLVGKLCLNSLSLPLSCNLEMLHGDIYQFGKLVAGGWDGSFVGLSVATNTLSHDLAFYADEYGLRYATAKDYSSPIPIWLAPRQ